MIEQFLYGAAGILLFALGLWSLLVHTPLLRKLIALNIMGAGVFHVFIAIAHRSDGLPPDPVPHALVLTGIVVAVSATALALTMNSRLEQDDVGRSAPAAASGSAPAEQPGQSSGAGQATATRPSATEPPTPSTDASLISLNVSRRPDSSPIAPIRP
jgi:multicomponent Na+:H+ antiporter subunit C